MSSRIKPWRRADRRHEKRKRKKRHSHIPAPDLDILQDAGYETVEGYDNVKAALADSSQPE